MMCRAERDQAWVDMVDREIGDIAEDPAKMQLIVAAELVAESDSPGDLAMRYAELVITVANACRGLKGLDKPGSGDRAQEAATAEAMAALRKLADHLSNIVEATVATAAEAAVRRAA